MSSSKASVGIQFRLLWWINNEMKERDIKRTKRKKRTESLFLGVAT